MEKKNNIILIGMPGAGKSTIGIVLAKVLGYEFVDTDLLIQKETGKLLWQIIEEKGLDAFTEIEEKVNLSVNANHSIIAPGGSIVYCEKAMKHYQEQGLIVYLETDLPTIRKRVGNFEHRGIACRVGRTLDDIYKERVPLYEKYADLIIHETDDNLSVTVSMIVDALK